MINQPTRLMFLLGAMGTLPLASAQPAPITSTETATEEKSLETAHQTARALLKANNGEESVRKGFQMMLEAAEKGYLPAMASVANAYNIGRGTPTDNAAAAKWFRLAAEKEHAISRYNLGKLLVADEIPLPEGAVDRKTQHSEGVEWIKKAADQGVHEAQATYGLIFLLGDFGTKPDATAAAGYFKLAAEAGNLEAMNALGCLYRTSRGVTSNPSEAERLFRRAAMAGHVKAQANLGEYLNPSSENRDQRIEALAWLFIAEDAKNVSAQKILAIKLTVTSPDDIAAGKEKATEIKGQLQEQKK